MAILVLEDLEKEFLCYFDFDLTKMPFLTFLAASLSLVSASGKVNVTQFCMAKCPMTTSLHVDFARQVNQIVVSVSPRPASTWPSQPDLRLDAFVGTSAAIATSPRPTLTFALPTNQPTLPSRPHATAAAPCTAHRSCPSQTCGRS